jgi:hypothetical protein
MTRKIKGKVMSTTKPGPLKGYKVEAYDHDDFDDDDFMGRAITNSEGDFSITYKGGHWDPAPHEWTWWRPDIYIQIFAPIDAPGDWIRVYQSKTFGDWPLRNDLYIPVFVTPPSPNARTVYGQIKWARNSWSEASSPGEPASDLRIRAYDEDPFPFPHDFMGEDTTNSNGEYRIRYKGGHWDTATHESGLWRPDIYIIAEVARDGVWKSVFRSGVQGDVRHSEGVRIDGEAYFAPPRSDTGSSIKNGTIWTLRNCSNLEMRIKFNDEDWFTLIAHQETSGIFVKNGEKFTVTTQMLLGHGTLGDAWTQPYSFDLLGSSTTIDYGTKDIGGTCL